MQVALATVWLHSPGRTKDFGARDCFLFLVASALGLSSLGLVLLYRLKLRASPPPGA